MQKTIDSDIRFRKLIENSHAGISLLDKNYKTIYRSPSAQRITGWQTSDRVNVSMQDVIHPSELLQVNLVLQEVMQTTDLSQTCSFRSRHFNGHYIWIECTFTNMLHEPDVNAIVCNFIDITDKKRSEELLQQTIHELSAYKKALDESAIVAITDQKGIIKHVNDNFCKISKYTADELLGKDHSLINSGYHDKAYIRGLWTTIAHGHTWKGELKNKAKDGSYYWVDTSIVPFLNEDGKPYQYVAIRSDITQRKINQEQIVDSERFVKTLADALPVMIAYWTANLQCLFANKAYREGCDLKPDEMLKVNRMDLMGPDKQMNKKLEEHIAAVLKGQPQSFETSVTGAGGDTIFYKIQYIPDVQNNITKGYYALAYNITEAKQSELEIKRTTAQVVNLLESISDGFISLDQNLCYTYANRQVAKMLNLNTSSLMGRYIWDMFPDAVGSATYHAIEEAVRENKFVSNEDYYAPLNLWQENRIYPTGEGLSIFIRDITQQKHEEHHLKLLESVITQTNDAVMITEAIPLHEPGPGIMYVNNAFTRMTGYTAAEVVGKSPRFLQGPQTDVNELKRINEALHKGERCQTTVVNYKNNGEAYWVNFSVSPVMDSSGSITHFISVERNVTEQKNAELQQTLLAEIGAVFNNTSGLNNTLKKVLEKLAHFGNFSMAEAWLINSDKDEINLVARFPFTTDALLFYSLSAHIKSFKKGEGLPGAAWQAGRILHWRDLDTREAFLRRDAAKLTGLKTAYGIPLQSGDEVIGVLLLGLNKDEERSQKIYTGFFERFSAHLSAEIKRKQLEEQLHRIFNSAPDVICIAGTDRYLKKINPAMCELLGYTQDELLSHPIDTFIHPDDVETSKQLTQRFIDGDVTLYFENRYISKSGRVIWLAWTATQAAEKGLLFCVAKDITEKKELEVLLNKATALANIGGWELDMIRNTVYWSPMTKQIHEVPADFEPSFEAALNFYVDNESRQLLLSEIETAVRHGSIYDVELQITTACGNIKWIRVIGEAEFKDNVCVRVYGSFQYIDKRKRAEIAAKKALEDKNVILESIGDAFFAVDKNWMVTYWNSVATQLLGKTKEEMLNKNLWYVFADAVNSVSYKKYHEAIETNTVIQFEDYYTPLEKWYEISAYPSADGLSVYFKDITDRTRYVKAVEEQNKRLSEISWLQSHVIRAPLSRIMGLVQLIQNIDLHDGESEQILEYILTSANELDDVIRNITDKTRTIDCR